MSAYQQMKAAIEGLLPDGWKFTAYEPLDDLPDVTGVTMKVRSVQRLPAAPMAKFQVDWVLTVTSPYTSRESADPQLFDDLIEFLIALDEANGGIPGLGAIESTKTVGDDFERLAYDITVQSEAERQTDEPG
ncbi:5-formaminoimidazole-4-carboxamide-1-beta-D-ribofuranosyl 5'-monophosphate synthetase [Microbacterium trichothecenolyticum]|uniref:hypothetical protein n=1 Tax=Microbacterium trichothecenolyticum TaxID=69370 RepID=UPI00285A7E10|nr:hypothetical protein [Microbacterium trichothecenolyticum]MDR7113884.1 5-formaminoimidazole-4-carboxamide-1-beta-D-ribofuranosyl 5'-monophosphate synthetase [Microbacterium trichothecenolyticum]